MKEAARHLSVAGLLLLAGCAGAVGQGTTTPGEVSSPRAGRASTQPLFVIERSKNENVVRYDARLTADGDLDPERPVIVYWVLHAEDGRREELNWIERQKAYGFTIQAAASGGGYTMTIVPVPQREITIRRADGTVRAELRINGRRAVLEKVYVESSPGLLGPKVHYVKLSGKEIETGEGLVEKISP